MATTQDTAITARRRYAQSLLAQGMQATPVQHWSQALARAVQGGMGGYLSHQADEEERAKDKEIAALLSGAPGLGSTPSEPPLPQPTAGPRSPSFSPVTTLSPEPAAQPSPYQVAGMAPQHSQDTFRTPLDAMRPPASQLAAALQGGHPTTGRPMLPNADGSVSTEKTITVEMDGKHYNIPTIVNGQRLSNEEAVSAMRAGRNQPVGVFGSAEEAEAAARQRSNSLGAAINPSMTGMNPAGATPVQTQAITPPRQLAQ